MVATRHRAAIVLAGLLWGLGLGSLDGALGLTGPTLTAFTGGLVLAGCLVAGYEWSRTRSDTGAQFFGPVTDPAFWTLHALFVWLALAAFGEWNLPGVTSPLSQIVSGLGLLATSATVVRRDGVPPAVDPRVWVRQFRAGKRDALSN
jgi:hypothetical protein